MRTIVIVFFPNLMSDFLAIVSNHQFGRTVAECAKDIKFDSLSVYLDF